MWRGKVPNTLSPPPCCLLMREPLFRQGETLAELVRHSITIGGVGQNCRAHGRFSKTRLQTRYEHCLQRAGIDCAAASGRGILAASAARVSRS